MKAQVDLYQKAEEELYRLQRPVKAAFEDFLHLFRRNPRHGSLQLKKLKGGDNLFSARVGTDHRALLARTGTDPDGAERWLVMAIRDRKDVYDQLSVAVNRVSGAIEFVDLSVVGPEALQRAGIRLTPAEPDEDAAAPATQTRTPPQPDRAGPSPTATPLLADHTADDLRDLGVADSLADVALTLTDSGELDLLLTRAPQLSIDVLTGLASGMSVEEVRAEITATYRAEAAVDTGDFAAALARTPVVTTTDDAVRAELARDFASWRIYLHPQQQRLVERDYSGSARVSGGPGTGKTVVALYRVQHLVRRLEQGATKPVLLTTFTKNLAADLRLRLADLLTPEEFDRVEVVHIDQLVNRVLGENLPPGKGRNRIDDRIALRELRDLLDELDDHTYDAEFLLEEWEQVILGQSVTTRAEYFKARRAGRGRALGRPERAAVWRIIEQFTAHLAKQGKQTWAQAAEQAARLEMERAAKIAARRAHKEEVGGVDLIHRDTDSGMRYIRHRYQHIVVDEAQDLRAAHWKMLRAMVDPGRNDLFIAGDTYQRIYDNNVALGTVGINIRGRSTRLTLSYRTTREILAAALGVMAEATYDDLDDGTETLAGYRSILHGPVPVLASHGSWADELDALAATIAVWRKEIAEPDPARANAAPPMVGRIAVCVPDHERAQQVMYHLATSCDPPISCAELTKDGPRGDGEVHVGTMHRFKGLEYQRLAIVAVTDGIVPRHAIDRYQATDPARHTRELSKARSLLFVAATRPRDALVISWHGQPSRFLGVRPEAGA